MDGVLLLRRTVLALQRNPALLACAALLAGTKCAFRLCAALADADQCGNMHTAQDGASCPMLGHTLSSFNYRQNNTHNARLVLLFAAIVQF